MVLKNYLEFVKVGLLPPKQKQRLWKNAFRTIGYLQQTRIMHHRSLQSVCLDHFLSQFLIQDLPQYDYWISWDLNYYQNAKNWRHDVLDHPLSGRMLLNWFS
jgi:hypothetical protein